MQPEVLIPVRNSSPLVTILSQINPVHALPLNSSIYSHVLLAVFPQASPLKPCTQLDSPPYVLHAPPISIFFT